MAREENAKRTDYTGVIIGAILLPIYLLFYVLGREQMGLTAFIAIGIVLLAIRIRWDLRRYIWFWITIALVFAVHLPLIFLVRWPQSWVPAVVIIPVALIDCFAILGVFRLIEKFNVRS